LNPPLTDNNNQELSFFIFQQEERMRKIKKFIFIFLLGITLTSCMGGSKEDAADLINEGQGSNQTTNEKTGDSNSSTGDNENLANSNNSGIQNQSQSTFLSTLSTLDSVIQNDNFINLIQIIFESSEMAISFFLEDDEDNIGNGDDDEEGSYDSNTKRRSSNNSEKNFLNNISEIVNFTSCQLVNDFFGCSLNQNSLSQDIQMISEMLDLNLATIKIGFNTSGLFLLNSQNEKLISFFGEQENLEVILHLSKLADINPYLEGSQGNLKLTFSVNESMASFSLSGDNIKLNSVILSNDSKEGSKDYFKLTLDESNVILESLNLRMSGDDNDLIQYYGSIGLWSNKPIGIFPTVFAADSELRISSTEMGMLSLVNSNDSLPVSIAISQEVNYPAINLSSPLTLSGVFLDKQVNITIEGDDFNLFSILDLLEPEDDDSNNEQEENNED
jgi:hypothetical protein